MRSVRKKSFPIFGSVVGISWKANSTELAKDIAARLSADLGIQDGVLSIGDVTIYSNYYEINGDAEVVIETMTNKLPSPGEWNTVNAIGRQIADAIKHSG